MTWPKIATLNGTNLPVQFSYKPYIPKKRNTTTATANGVVIQYANPQIVHGEGTLPFTIPGCTPPEYQTLWTLYNTSTPTGYTFVGYWGETLTVYFSTLDEPTVRSRFFDVSGMLQVLSIDVDYNPECEG
jgi:hypothetical protein